MFEAGSACAKDSALLPCLNVAGTAILSGFDSPLTRASPEAFGCQETKKP
ncbi:MAG TPA: hypothetical protein VMR19_04655 [Candidatus Saccharimonadales bacterium]|nr:hypothetical protein [Candidatus Saccharimonadales bacterium]